MSVVKGKSFKASCCFIVVPQFLLLPKKFSVQCDFWLKMACLWLGVLISKAYVNHTKANKVEGLVVVSEGPKLIHHEEKLAVIFHHPPMDQQTEEFDCWTIHRFAHVTEEGEESGLFATPNSGGGNNGRPLGVSQPNPNIEQTTTHTTQTTTQATDGAQGNNDVPLEIIDMLESNLAGVDSENATLICNMVPGMVDDNNQPLPKNVPLPADEAPNAPQLFSYWEHSGNWYCCLEGGRRNKARLSFNAEVKPTIKQLFEMFSSWKSSSPEQISTYNMINIGPPPMESSFIGWVSGSSWQQSMVQIITISGHSERLIVLLVLP